jgi:hypothetical protein
LAIFQVDCGVQDHLLLPFRIQDAVWHLALIFATRPWVILAFGIKHGPTYIPQKGG